MLTQIADTVKQPTKMYLAKQLNRKKQTLLFVIAILRKLLQFFKSQFSYRQHGVFTTRYLRLTSQTHTVLESTAICLSFLVSIAGITGMNKSVENNVLHLLAKQVK